MRQSTRAFALCLALAGPCAAIDNGLGLTPPRGWRSWNAFDCMKDETILTQSHMEAQMVAALDRSRTVGGKPTSLVDLGFNYISMDDGWQKCNCSVRQDLDPALPACQNLCFSGGCTWHDAAGEPVVRKDRFSDMKALVDYGHSLGLHVGSYLNNCICMEAAHSPTHYEQDVKWLVDMGFDEVKIDSCGSSKNVTHWAELINASGRQIRIENCHNAWPDFKTGFCPMNFWRTGGDISANIDDILYQAHATVDASDLPVPRSHPGCWGYPDMSEVGNFPNGPDQLDKEMTHWGLWCTISSPLILGFDMNDTEKMDRVWPVITNLDALSVSEAWVGHPGTLTNIYPASSGQYHMIQAPCDGSPRTLGWRFRDGMLVSPALFDMPTPMCLHAPQAEVCPPPTMNFKDVQCGLFLESCELPQKGGNWYFTNSAVQWVRDDPSQEPQCLGAFRMNFDVTQGYFTRQAAQVKMGNCKQMVGMLHSSSCATTRKNVDVDGPGVIKPKNASKVCNVDQHTCCTVCDADPECKAYVWKADEQYGTDCPGGGSYCWLLSDFSGLHSGPGIFGTKTAPPPQPPTPTPTGPAVFNLTAAGELRTSSGTCLAAAPANGIEMWSKPMTSSKVAVLLVNPTAAQQQLPFPIADIPSFGGIVNTACTPGSCVARDVWAQKDMEVTSDHMYISLRPFASSFLIFSAKTMTPDLNI